jgi:hypothetical protein
LRQSKDDSPAVIVAASSSFPDNVEVQVSVFKLMNTCIQSDADQALFVEAGAIEAAAVALTRHHSDADVARAVCRILGSLVMGSTPNQDRAAALGLIESIMTVFTENPVTDDNVALAAGRMIMGRSAPPTLVAVPACSAISALVSGHPANKERAGAAGACEIVVKLLQVRLLFYPNQLAVIFPCSQVTHILSGSVSPCRTIPVSMMFCALPPKPCFSSSLTQCLTRRN